MSLEIFAEEIKSLEDHELKYLAHRLWIMSHDINLYENTQRNKRKPVASILALDKIVDEWWAVCYREQQARGGKISSKYKRNSHE